MNKKTVALTEEQYKLIITTIRQGFICSDGHIVKPNNRVATALSLEANLGLRISDILHLRLSDIIRDGDRYRLNIIEQKTQKRREFTVPTDIYIFTFSHMHWKIIYIQMQNYLIYLKELLQSIWNLHVITWCLRESVHIHLESILRQVYM